MRITLFALMTLAVAVTGCSSTFYRENFTDSAHDGYGPRSRPYYGPENPSLPD